MKYKFSKKSLGNLAGCEPGLIEITNNALKKGYIDFGISCGLRTLDKQKEYVRTGRSQTLDSLHLEQKDGFSHAVDLFWYDSQGIDVFTLESKKLASAQQIIDGWNQLAKAMFASAMELGIVIEWGGFWKGSWDKSHFQVPLA